MIRRVRAVATRWSRSSAPRAASPIVADFGGPTPRRRCRRSARCRTRWSAGRFPQVGPRPARPTSPTRSRLRRTGGNGRRRRRWTHRRRGRMTRKDTRSPRRARSCCSRAPPSPGATSLDRSSGARARCRPSRSGTGSRSRPRYRPRSRNRTARRSGRTTEPEAVEPTSPRARPPRRFRTARPAGTSEPGTDGPCDETRSALFLGTLRSGRGQPQGGSYA